MQPASGSTPWLAVVQETLAKLTAASVQNWACGTGRGMRGFMRSQGSVEEEGTVGDGGILTCCDFDDDDD
mgnify:CR=1 FL=1